MESVAVKRRFGFANYFNWVGILMIHVGVGIALYRGNVTWQLVALAVVSYLVRMFGITGAYHRYFAHRTFKTSRPFQFLLAFIGTAATQKGPLWWASGHRQHHKYSDTDKDLHSPVRRGFWYSHMGWWLGGEHDETRLDLIQDFARYPEIRFLERFHYLGIAATMLLGWAYAGFDGFLWIYVVSTCFLLHSVFFVNSLAHVSGSRRFETGDDSRNNAFIAFLTLGEGWHNNHHHYQSSCRQGFYWWEIDITYYVIKVFSFVGLVWDVREPPARVYEEAKNGAKLSTRVAKKKQLATQRPQADSDDDLVNDLPVVASVGEAAAVADAELADLRFLVVQTVDLSAGEVDGFRFVAAAVGERRRARTSEALLRRSRP
jgi:stearoyl-CoA desaturase (delta-9 desaturase)